MASSRLHDFMEDFGLDLDFHTNGFWLALDLNRWLEETCYLTSNRMCVAKGKSAGHRTVEPCQAHNPAEAPRCLPIIPPLVTRSMLHLLRSLPALLLHPTMTAKTQILVEKIIIIIKKKGFYMRHHHVNRHLWTMLFRHFQWDLKSRQRAASQTERQ